MTLRRLAQGVASRPTTSRGAFQQVARGERPKLTALLRIAAKRLAAGAETPINIHLEVLQ